MQQAHGRPRARRYPSNWSVSPSPAKLHLPSHGSCLAIRGNPGNADVVGKRQLREPDRTD
jgi:hypothetical protein